MRYRLERGKEEEGGRKEIVKFTMNSYER